jgi:hypothetical protein
VGLIPLTKTSSRAVSTSAETKYTDNLSTTWEGLKGSIKRNPGDLNSWHSYVGVDGIIQQTTEAQHTNKISNKIKPNEHSNVSITSKRRNLSYCKLNKAKAIDVPNDHFDISKSIN